MKKTCGFTLINVVIGVVVASLLASLILLQINAQTQEADLKRSLQKFETIKRAAGRYLRLKEELSKDLWTPAQNPCNPTLPQGELKWSALGLDDPHLSDSKWYYVLYIGKNRSFSIGAISKDCNVRFLEVIHPHGKTEWTCAENAGMRPIREKDGTVTGCTYL